MKNSFTLFILSILVLGNYANAAGTKLHCTGGNLTFDAVIKSDTLLTSAALNEKVGDRVPDIETQGAQLKGDLLNHFRSDSDLDGISLADPSEYPSDAPITGRIVSFNLTDTSWGRIVILPQGFEKKAKKFEASAFEFEPAEQDVGGTYQSLSCSVSS